MKLFVENLTNVDFSYLHPQRGLMGESWLVQLELDGSLNEQGMICDFGIVKQAVKRWFDTYIDHTLVIPTGMPRLSFSQDAGYTQVEWLYSDGRHFSCRAPGEAIALVGIPEVTAPALAGWCREKLLQLFPQEVKGLEVRFLPERIDGAFYHYSHGLQQHEGNCQRIAHGHRSKLEIYLDDQRAEALEDEWAARFQDIYLGTRAHLVGEAEGCHYYRYTAPQGAFELRLPAERCYLMETKTTVELIASHLAQQIKRSHPRSAVTVRAYEGVGKGAIASA